MSYFPKTNLKAARSGTVTLGITDLTKAVTFSTVMADANYNVALTPHFVSTVLAYVTNRTASGFVVNVASGLVGDMGYVAVAN